VLKLLLDEHISPDVADGLRRRNRSLVIHWMAEWQGSDFLGKEDSVCLQEAAKQGLTLVTYDRRTIPPLLKTWAEEGRRHGGVIFIDEKTISPANIGVLVRALIQLFKETGKWDWTDRVYFLRRQR
jgi:predicted nuclease of predicted toxin-antitoxin system